jgi:hypothetical protein
MNTIRKFDFYGQLTLGSVMIISIPFLFLYGFLLGLFFLGCWQLLSASLNTTSFMRSGYKKKIFTYWKWTAVDLLLLLICFPSFELFTTAYMEILMITCLGGSVIIAVYYLYIYHKLINQIEFKKELSGFLKS